MRLNQSSRVRNEPTTPAGSAGPAESAARANVVPASRDPYSVLSINGGSSSIRFAVYERGESFRRLLEGEVDRVGLDLTNSTFADATGKPQNRRAIESENPVVAVAFLLDWLEAQPVFASVKTAGHRCSAWDHTGDPLHEPPYFSGW